MGLAVQIFFLLSFSVSVGLFAESSAAHASDESGLLEVYLSPARRYLDWSSPKTISKTFLDSRLRAHELNPLKVMKTAMGHGMAHVACMNFAGEKVEFWTGITGQDDPHESKDLVFKEKVGMGVLFHEFKDGFIQQDDAVIATLSSYRGRVESDRFGETHRLKPRFVQYAIGPEQCEALQRFYSAFTARQLGQPTLDEVKTKNPSEVLIFGLLLDPYALYLENLEKPGSKLGGGCTSYATAFLKAAGVYDPIFDEFFLRNLRMSQGHVIGTPNEKVPFLSLIFGKRGRSWLAQSDLSQTQEIAFYDPEMIYDTFDAMLSCSSNRARGSTGCTYPVAKWMRAKEAQGALIRPVTQVISGSYRKRMFSNQLEGIRIEGFSR